MGKEDRGSPVLIFPSNPSASTATAPPQRQRDRCCEDAGENSLLKESFRLQSERNTQSVTWSTFALIGLDMSASSLSLPIFLRINFLISYLIVTDSQNTFDWHTQRALLNDKKLAPAAHHVLLSILVMTSPHLTSGRQFWLITHMIQSWTTLMAFP